MMLSEFCDSSAHLCGWLLTRLQTNTDGGHFLKDDVKAFDASFFGINPVEATVRTICDRSILR